MPPHAKPLSASEARDALEHRLMTKFYYSKKAPTLDQQFEYLDEMHTQISTYIVGFHEKEHLTMGEQIELENALLRSIQIVRLRYELLALISVRGG